MASSIISDLTSDEKLSESVRKYPVLFDKSGCDFKSRLKKQMARADVASELGLQNGKIRLSRKHVQIYSTFRPTFFCFLKKKKRLTRYFGF